MMRIRIVISLFAIFITLVIFQSNSIADNPLVIILGNPLVKNMSDIEGTEQLKLADKDASKYTLVITHNGENFIWSSRDNRPLFYSHTGNFHNFIEPNGAGYIRVARIDEDKCIYMEHLTLGMKNITYWGVSEVCGKDLE